MAEKSLLEKIISSDANLTFLMVNVCGILWFATVKGIGLPDGMVTIVLGIFTGKTVHSVMEAKSKDQTKGDSILSSIKGTKKP